MKRTTTTASLANVVEINIFCVTSVYYFFHRSNKSRIIGLWWINTLSSTSEESCLGNFMSNCDYRNVYSIMLSRFLSQQMAKLLPFTGFWPDAWCSQSWSATSIVELSSGVWRWRQSDSRRQQRRASTSSNSTLHLFELRVAFFLCCLCALERCYQRKKKQLFNANDAFHSLSRYPDMPPSLYSALILRKQTLPCRHSSRSNQTATRNKAFFHTHVQSGVPCLACQSHSLAPHI